MFTSVQVRTTACVLFTYFKNILYFWLHWIFIAAHGLSLVAASRLYPLVVELGLLIAAVSLVTGRGLWSADPVVVAHGLSCSAACGSLPDQG